MTSEDDFRAEFIKTFLMTDTAMSFAIAAHSSEVTQFQRGLKVGDYAFCETSDSTVGEETSIVRLVDPADLDQHGPVAVDAQTRLERGWVPVLWIKEGWSQRYGWFPRRMLVPLGDEGQKVWDHFDQGEELTEEITLILDTAFRRNCSLRSMDGIRPGICNQCGSPDVVIDSVARSHRRFSFVQMDDGTYKTFSTRDVEKEIESHVMCLSCGYTVFIEEDNWSVGSH